jgi:hypothetical protein
MSLVYCPKQKPILCMFESKMKCLEICTRSMYPGTTSDPAHWKYCNEAPSPGPSFFEQQDSELDDNDDVSEDLSSESQVSDLEKVQPFSISSPKLNSSCGSLSLGQSYFNGLPKVTKTLKSGIFFTICCQ